MSGLLLPLVFSLLAVVAGLYCRFKGSRYLLVGLGGLTTVSLIVLIAVALIGGASGCQGGAVRSMTCPGSSLMSNVLLPLGRIAGNLSLPGLAIGPFAAPFAGLAEFWARKNGKV